MQLSSEYNSKWARRQCLAYVDQCDLDNVRYADTCPSPPLSLVQLFSSICLSGDRLVPTRDTDNEGCERTQIFLLMHNLMYSTLRSLFGDTLRPLHIKPDSDLTSLKLEVHHRESEVHDRESRLSETRTRFLEVLLLVRRCRKLPVDR